MRFPVCIASGFAFAALLLAALPGSLEAQTCLGPPTPPGEVAFVGNRSSQGVTTSYGGRFHANLGGAVSLGAGFSVDTFDDLATNGFTTGLGVGIPRSVGELSICPATDVQYSEVTPRGPETEDPTLLHSFTLRPGMGLGIDLPLTANISLGAHARPAVLLVLGEHARVRGGRGRQDPDRLIHAEVTGGLLLRVERIFVGVETTRSTLPGEPAARLHLGMLR